MAWISHLSFRSDPNGAPSSCDGTLISGGTNFKRKNTAIKETGVDVYGTLGYKVSY